MSRIWDWLRMTRSSPGGLAKSDSELAEIYRAAIQQFEELISAAETSGPASRPLPLFYALTQAGRAIAAVRGGPAHRGHGLLLGQLESDALHTLVTQTAGGKFPGHFEAVAVAIGSPTLDGPAQLGALLASLPEMSETLLLHDDWPQALAIFERDPPYGVATPDWIHVSIVVDQVGIDYDDLLKFLEIYPAMKGRIGVAQAVRALGSLPSYPTPEGNGVGVMFNGTPDDLESAAPQHRISGRRWVRPAIAGGKPPDPTMTWWALLYGLSMYARYHPREWVAALDIDSSPVGVTLERAMDRAIEALPQLVLSAVLDRQFLVPAVEGFGPDPFGRGRA